MNDDQLTTVHDDQLAAAVKGSLTGVHMNTPLQAIVSRGRMVRARRRIPGLAAALAVLAAAAVAVGVLLPASHQASMRLAAWTVARQDDGTIKVTIRQLRNPAGLQHTLRADGVPASVTFFRTENPACRNIPKPSVRLTEKVIHVREYGRSEVVMLVHPRALPGGAGVGIAVGYARLGGKKGLAFSAGLVQASPRCTGG